MTNFVLKSLGKSNSVILTHLNDRLIVKTDFRGDQVERVDFLEFRVKIKEIR